MKESIQWMKGEDVDWIQLVQDTDKLQALVNTIVTLRVSCNTATLASYLRIYQLLKKVSNPYI
jgi:hypothetical protein